VVPLVGDPQRDRAVIILRRAYAEGYLGSADLERRVDAALRAGTATQIFGSVRGVPGGVTELALEGVAIPAVRAGTFPVRLRLAYLLLRLAFRTWVIATAVLATTAAVWALLTGLALGGALALASLWVIVSGCAYALSRGARRLSRP
jgi:hypothetical protein